MPTKASIQYLSLLHALIAGFSFMLRGLAVAQTFTTLHTFIGAPSDGANPYSTLVLSGTTMYGTAPGGTNFSGIVFAVNNDGTDFKTLHAFTKYSYNYSTLSFSNADGIIANAGLILSSNTLYGTTFGGGTNGYGTVFSVNTNGTDFTVIYTFSAASTNGFTNSDGANPQAGLVSSGSTLYGAAPGGGTNGSGTLFAVNTDGTGFTVLHTFASLLRPASSGGGGSGGGRGGGGSQPPGTNYDGCGPQSGLILSGNTLYGTAYLGGTSGYGSVFAVNTNGSGFTTLHNFTYSSEGANPYSSLVLSGNTLYGTTYWSSNNGNGTVFAVNTNGTNFRILHDFAAGNQPSEYYLYTNSDGANPYSGLVLSGDTLYGTTYWGSTNGGGTVFALNTNGTGFTTLYTFRAPLGPISGSKPHLTNSDGAFLYSGLVLSGNTLYGTAENGGTNGDGTVFSLSYPSPQLTIECSSTNVNVAWPSSLAGFSYSTYSLQFATNLASPSNWRSVPSSPVPVNGQNTVTNSISGGQMFYRLSQ